MLWNLKMRLAELKLRQRDAAKLLGVSESTISSIVTGFKDPTPVFRKKAARMLGSTEDYLFTKKISN